MQRTLHALRDAGRLDVLRLLADRKLRLPDVHEDYVRSPAALQHRLAAAASPALGPLLDQWFAWLDDPAALSSKTRRPYAPKTTQRYKVSWSRILALLPRGRDAVLTDVTKGFLADFRAQRRREGASGATINRDLCAFSACLTWCEQEQEIDVRRPAIPRERESAGRERWLDAAELSQLEAALPRSWWPLFAALAYTGLRVGEAQGLYWSDVRLSDQVIHGARPKAPAQDIGERACGTHRGAAGAPVSRTSDALPRRTRGPRVSSPVRLLSAGATLLPARLPKGRPARRPDPRPQAHLRRTLRASRHSDRPHPAAAWALDARDGIALHEARARELLRRRRGASGCESVRRRRSRGRCAGGARAAGVQAKLMDVGCATNYATSQVATGRGDSSRGLHKPLGLARFWFHWRGGRVAEGGVLLNRYRA